MQQPMDQVEMMSGSALHVRHSTDVEADYVMEGRNLAVHEGSVKCES